MELHRRFPTFTDFKEVYDDFVKQEQVPWVIESSKKVEKHNEANPEKGLKATLGYAFVCYTCKHYGNRRVASKGLRPNQSSFKKECKAKLRITADHITQELVVTVFNKNHSHKVREEDKLFYPENRKVIGEDLESAQDMLKKEVKPSIIKDILQNHTGLCVTSQDIVNLRAKVNREREKKRLEARKASKEKNGKEVEGNGNEKLSKAEEELHDLLDEIEDLKRNDPDATVIVGRGEDDVIQFLFWCNSKMKQDFEKYPEILAVDNTYNTNKNRMPLAVFICIDGEGHGRVAGYCFIISEERDVLRDSFDSFCQCYSSLILKTSTVMVDKDPNQIAVIRQLMPHVTIHICRFHCTQIFKRQLKTYGEDKDNLKTLSKMMFACTEEEYVKRYDELKKNVSPEFMAYFDEYWHESDLVWKGHERHYLETYGVTTTNAVESHHSKIKHLLNRRRTLAECLRHLQLLHRNKNSQTQFENFLSYSKVSYVVDNHDSVVDALVNSCTKYAAKLLRRELFLSSKGEAQAEEMDVDLKLGTCSCSFNKTFNLPCKHIFVARRNEGQEIFAAYQIPARWRRASSPEAEIETNQENSAPAPVFRSSCPVKVGGRIMTQAEKYRHFQKLVTKASDLAASCGGRQYWDRCEAVQSIIDLWENGFEAEINKKNVARVEGGKPRLNNKVVFSSQAPAAVGIVPEEQQESTTVLREAISENEDSAQIDPPEVTEVCADAEAKSSTSDTDVLQHILVVPPDANTEPQVLDIRNTVNQLEDNVLQSSSSQNVFTDGDINAMRSTLKLPPVQKIRGQPRTRGPRKTKRGGASAGTSAAAPRATAPSAAARTKRGGACKGLSDKQCSACSKGHFPQGAHKCVSCDKNVHALDGCSVALPKSSENEEDDEGFGQKRICQGCLKGSSTITVKSQEVKRKAIVQLGGKRKAMKLVSSGEPTSEKDTSDGQRMEKGQVILDGDVRELSLGTWRVESQSEEGKSYVVALQDTFPCCNCMDPSNCVHWYECNCPDNNSPCKHIFKVHAMLQSKAGPGSVSQVPISCTDRQTNYTLETCSEILNNPLEDLDFDEGGLFDEFMRDLPENDIPVLLSPLNGLPVPPPIVIGNSKTIDHIPIAQEVETNLGIQENGQEVETNLEIQENGQLNSDRNFCPSLPPLECFGCHTFNTERRISKSSKHFGQEYLWCLVCMKFIVWLSKKPSGGSPAKRASPTKLPAKLASPAKRASPTKLPAKLASPAKRASPTKLPAKLASPDKSPLKQSTLLRYAVGFRASSSGQDEAKSRETRGQEIPDSHVRTINEKCWNVKSQKKASSEYYEVSRSEGDCSKCMEKIPVCEHVFKCTCPDFVFRKEACKHIHKVQQLGVNKDFPSTSLDIRCAAPSKSIPADVTRMSVSALNELRNGDVLSDEHVKVAQNMLAEMFKDKIDGFSFPLSVKYGEEIVIPYAYPPATKDRDYVQILHTGRHHWVTAILRKGSSDIVIMDSMRKEPVTGHVKLQAAMIARTERNKLLIVRPPCKQQTNGIDCGLFAIAFAIEFCFSRSTAHIDFDQTQFRSHWEQCLAEKEIKPFPRLSQRPKKSKYDDDDTCLIDVFCTCRLPAALDNMVQCDTCGGWYHQRCVDAQGGAADWLCPKCA